MLHTWLAPDLLSEMFPPEICSWNELILLVHRLGLGEKNRLTEKEIEWWVNCWIEKLYTIEVHVHMSAGSVNFSGLVKRYNSWQGREEMDRGRSERVHTMDSFERRWTKGVREGEDESAGLEFMNMLNEAHPFHSMISPERKSLLSFTPLQNSGYFASPSIASFSFSIPFLILEEKESIPCCRDPGVNLFNTQKNFTLSSLLFRWHFSWWLNHTQNDEHFVTHSETPEPWVGRVGVKMWYTSFRGWRD